jgi:hypothetical protein
MLLLLSVTLLCTMQSPSALKKCFLNQQKPHVLRFRQKGDYNQHQRLYSMDRSHSKLRLWTNITAWYLRTCHLGILGIFHSCSRKFCICCWPLVWKACKSKGHATRANRGSLSRNNESHLQLDDIHYFHNKKGLDPRSFQFLPTWTIYELRPDLQRH